MKTINLRDFYYWYTQDEFIEVSDEVAEEMLADKRHQKSQERQMFRYKAQYTLDADNGIEAAAIIHTTDDPESILEMKERFCSLCRALNSLPEIQGRRIEAHYILGMSRKDIAADEDVTESAVNTSIERGLRAMKKYLLNSDNLGCQTTDFCQSC
jgi:DNA-directed RNA polymerase specialized sigma subunit, sigma24 homolog